jgi:predicted peptidase
MKNSIYFTLFLSLFFLSCSDNNITNDPDLDNNENNAENNLDSLPKDTGGLQKAFTLGSTNAIYGHYVYTPSNYDNNSPDYPLLVFLHGSGQIGNSTANSNVLNRVLEAAGPQNMINNNKWSPKYPMIVASPQLTSGRWNPDDVHNFIKYIIDNYNIDVSRIYLTGYSLGAFGCFDYISQYGDDAYSKAIVPIAGRGNINTGNKFVNVAVWAFHGENDGSVSVNGSIDMINAINNAKPKNKAKLTLYPGAGHDTDTRTFDGTGMGTEDSKYDPFNINIYEWMFKFKK